MKIEQGSIYFKYFLKVIPELDRQIKTSSYHLKSCLPEAFLKQVHPELSGYKRELRAAGILLTMPRNTMQPAFEFIISFQFLRFFLDFIYENKGINNEADINRLFQPLYDSVNLELSPQSHYEFFNSKSQEKYIKSMVESCRKQIALLPSYDFVSGKMKKHIQLYIGVQASKHLHEKLRNEELINWSKYYMQQFPEILYHEFAASSDILTGVFSLFISAFNLNLTKDDLRALDYAYSPWICSLHRMLQDYTTARENVLLGRLNFTNYYSNLKQCEERLIFLLSKSFEFTTTSECLYYSHELVKLLPSIYLSDPRSNFGLNRLASKNMLTFSSIDTRLLIIPVKLLRLFKV